MVRRWFRPVVHMSKDHVCAFLVSIHQYPGFEMSQYENLLPAKVCFSYVVVMFCIELCLDALNMLPIIVTPQSSHKQRYILQVQTTMPSYLHRKHNSM